MSTPLDQWCLDCRNAQLVAQTSACIVFKHLFRSCNVPPILAAVLVSYVHWHDAAADFERQYLLAVLLMRHSKFKQLTYFHNEKACNILIYEDIVDRVVAFVS